MAKVKKQFIVYGRPKQKLAIPSCDFCKNGNDHAKTSKCWKGITNGIATCFTLAAKYKDAQVGDNEVDLDGQEENEHAQIKK